MNRNTIIDECARAGWLAANTDCDDQVRTAILRLKKSYRAGGPARTVGMSPRVAEAADKTNWESWEQWAERSLEEFANHLLREDENASTIELLKAENARLREALDKIAPLDPK